MANIFEQLENQLTKVPVIKTIYGSIKDIFQFFISGNKEFSGVVLVNLNDSAGQLLGFITSEQPETDLGDALKGYVSVYLPMSYQIGGYTVLITLDRITRVSIGVEDTLRYILTSRRI